jgi:hypothetical protein
MPEPPAWDLERLVEILGREPGLVREALDRGRDHVLSRVVPDEVDREVVKRAAATVEAMMRVDALLRGISADVTDGAWSPAPADLDELRDRVETEWRSWREGLGRRS